MPRAPPTPRQAHSAEAKAALLSEGGRAGGASRISLLASVCALALDASAASAAVRSLAWALARSLASHAEGNAALQRLSFGGAAAGALHGALRGEADDVALLGSLELLANWSFAPEGVPSLLRAKPSVILCLEQVLEGGGHANGRPVQLGRVLAGPGGSPARRHELAAVAALALRNVAQHAEGKAHVLASERALPALIAALALPDESGRLAANASAALWALVRDSAKAKASLKSAPLLQVLVDVEGRMRELAADSATVCGRGGGGAGVDESARRPFVERALRNLAATRGLLST